MWHQGRGRRSGAYPMLGPTWGYDIAVAAAVENDEGGWWREEDLDSREQGKSSKEGNDRAESM